MANPPKYVNPPEVTQEVDHWFTYHDTKGDQLDRYVRLRESAKRFAHDILDYVPPCADRSAAIRKLRECIMTANAAIACEE